MQREQQLSVLKLRYDSLKISVTAQEADLKAKDEDFKGAEAQRENLQQQEKLLSSELSVEQAALSGHNVRLQQQQQRLAQVMGEMTRLHDEQQDNAEQYEEAMMLKEEAEMAIETLLEHKEHLTATEQQLLTQREQSEALLQASRQQVQSLQAKQSSLTVLQGLTAKQIKRLSLHSQQAEARIAELTATLQTTDKQAMSAERDDLAVLKQSQVTLEQNLSQLRGQHTEADADIQSLSDDINALQHDLEAKKDELDGLQLDLQANKVRKQSVEEQSQELNLNLETLIAELSVDANETIWKKNLIKVEQQLSGLGVINLTAIEEYKSQAERMQFLTEQHTDLMEALSILDAAIIKIDQESRQRFKQTFDKINGGLQKKFPQLFGGGKAYLELTDKSALESGVNIIAQPPGKRNSSIHLLSGGEKALTAVALVFSIFELNPAPFCLLDEVDAPLDEANVRRFSDMIVEMSEKVQFLYISHNKVTMEIAEQLTPNSRVDDYTQAIMDLGATLCTRSKPDCDRCPMNKNCQAFQSDIQTSLPKSKPKKVIPQRHTWLVLIESENGARLLEKRAPAGIWGGLYSLPEFSTDIDEAELAKLCEQRFGGQFEYIEKHNSINHVFSHFKLELKPIKLKMMGTDLDSGKMTQEIKEPSSFYWFDEAQLNNIALPAPISKYLKALAKPLLLD